MPKSHQILPNHRCPQLFPLLKDGKRVIMALAHGAGAPLGEGAMDEEDAGASAVLTGVNEGGIEERCAPTYHFVDISGLDTTHSSATYAQFYSHEHIHTLSGHLSAEPMTTIHP
jgi:hypothetical protein